MYKTLFMLVLLLACAAAAFADIPRPDVSPKPVKKPETVSTYLSIRLDRDAKEARLIIPRSQLQSLRAELDALDEGATAGTEASSGISAMQTIVSGMFMSLGFIFAGIWIVRSGKLSMKTAAVAGIFVAAGVTTFVYGNAGPPSEARSITGKIFAPAMHMYKFGGGPIKLELSDREGTLELIVPDPQESKKAGEE